MSDVLNGYNVFIRRLREAHRTVESLCLVSKTFHALATELRYQYLFLQDTYNWSLLADGLEESRRADVGNGGHGTGWYVKRMEISTQCWTKELGVAAARIIRCCPNLRVLTVGVAEETGEVPMEIIQAVFESCPRALRSLDWTCDLGPDQTTEMFCLISKASNLQSLFMCVQQDFNAEHIERVKAAGPASLPQMHTLELVSPDFDPSPVLSIMASWDLPSLRQVVLCGQEALDDAHEFFSVHGPKLTTLEFDYAGEPEDSLPSTSPSGLPESGPQMLFARCPNLKELVLQVHWAATQARFGHPEIERIGLRGLHLFSLQAARLRVGGLALRPEHDAEQRAILRALKSAFPILIERSRFPKIKAVRLLDFDQSRFRSIPWRVSGVTFWAFWVRRFERLGVRLEDHEGQLVKVVFRELNVLLPEDEQPSIRCS